MARNSQQGGIQLTSTTTSQKKSDKKNNRSPEKQNKKTQQKSTVDKIKTNLTDAFSTLNTKLKKLYDKSNPKKKQLKPNKTREEKQNEILEVFPLFQFNVEETFDYLYGSNEKEINSIYKFIEHQNDYSIIRNELSVLFNDFIDSLINVLLTKNNLGYKLEKKKNFFLVFFYGS